MQGLGLLIGIISALLMVIAFLPCLAWGFWIIIPIAGLGVIVNGVALASAGHNRGAAVAGLILCIIVMFFGLFRLFVGGGII
ncbi:MAG: hypothetical protein ACOX5R_04500 [bacterium]|jgi:hypothetical protein